AAAPAARVDDELAEIGRAVSEEAASLPAMLAEMVRSPYRRATVFVVVLGFLIQITGINAIIYYSPRIFEAMGFTGNFALLKWLGIPQFVVFDWLFWIFSILIATLVSWLLFTWMIARLPREQVSFVDS
ncbi:MFS transporter, partial [Mycobacterium avium]|uniref:MFS transporter n=1 Tax=Mycobacterium avium TaxID=1764 RepID=UPI000A711CF1